MYQNFLDKNQIISILRDSNNFPISELQEYLNHYLECNLIRFPYDLLNYDDEYKNDNIILKVPSYLRSLLIEIFENIYEYKYLGEDDDGFIYFNILRLNFKTPLSNGIIILINIFEKYGYQKFDFEQISHFL